MIHDSKHSLSIALAQLELSLSIALAQLEHSFTDTFKHINININKKEIEIKAAEPLAVSSAALFRDGLRPKTFSLVLSFWGSL